MKKLAAMLLLAGCSSVAMAEVDYGVGVSVKDSDSFIYLPIDISESWRVEPSFRYYHYKNDYRSEFPSSSYENVELAVGVFKKKLIFENIKFLYGVRTGYFQTKIDSDYNTTGEGDGYIFTPTVSFEYLINRKFSVGGEVGLRYQKFNSNEQSESWFNTSGTSSEVITTTTGLNVRFYF